MSGETRRKKRIGVLAVQGAFAEHEAAFARLGAECFEIRQGSDVQACDALVLPGGESTTQGKLMRELGIFEGLKALVDSGTPTFATCAGLILLAEKIVGEERAWFGTTPIVARRNAYGRQLGSFNACLTFEGVGEVAGTFIRAPQIESIGKGAEILAQIDDRPVAVRFRNQWALAFHPELGVDDRIAKAFLESF